MQDMGNESKLMHRTVSSLCLDSMYILQNSLQTKQKKKGGLAMEIVQDVILGIIAFHIHRIVMRTQVENCMQLKPLFKLNMKRKWFKGCHDI